MPVKARQGDKSAKLTPDLRRRKIALLDAGITAADVAREAGVSRQTAWEVLMGKRTSQRVREVFARMTGQPVKRLFPTQAA
jgi:transcriptional regulator with XRE-family HTH domain